jgi:hypothetical protein
MIRTLLENRLVLFDLRWDDWSDILQAAQNLSIAELVRAADEAAKQAVLANTSQIEKENLRSAILEQQNRTHQPSLKTSV